MKPPVAATIELTAGQLDALIFVAANGFVVFDVPAGLTPAPPHLVRQAQSAIRALRAAKAALSPEKAPA